ncbi:hypothetical protein J40TS1_19560 [Paenibacillus montaniterrae]|uniref:Fungal lipase-type domain-containing protein n=1 Tax=Paenibacillus montaniterrae TaxID=429341 RepID=A0A920CYS3_9BACL|nr:lipase family protein [Paenibacillus montaniterrae]GIP16314.1 hypothetical protein J40TS1_19560 [Paenibacillus montaniterrae]
MSYHQPTRGLQEPNYQSALFLAAICSQTYVQFANKETGAFIKPEHYDLVGSIMTSELGIDHDRYGFVLASEQNTILAFRGSSTSIDWVYDFIAQQTEYLPNKNAGQTHKGFTDIYYTLRQQVMELLSHCNADHPLYITGHSLGGALATLAALDIASNTSFHAPIVYTFGAPRVGDPAFVRTYNYTVPVNWRFQNKYDIVPHLPTLVYHSPQTDETYFYLHVKGEVQRSFRHGSVSANHIMSSYFQDLADDMPDIAQSICSSPLGFCPVEETIKQAAHTKE